VLARNKEARAYFEKLFAAHRIERIYHAIVLGKPHPATGRIESRLRIDESGIVETTSEGGEPAITDYATVHVGRGHSVVACRLETGRRNQIRVQLADRGCPLVGDRKYGRHDPRFAEQPAPRTLLHATALGFVPPGRREPQNYVAPFPKDFARFLGEDVLRQLL
jgi:23S rRNA pseudouridine1911/1915/1917 synthase